MGKALQAMRRTSTLPCFNCESDGGCNLQIRIVDNSYMQFRAHDTLSTKFPFAKLFSWFELHIEILCYICKT